MVTLNVGKTDRIEMDNMVITMKWNSSFSLRVSALLAAACILFTGCGQQPSASSKPDSLDSIASFSEGLETVSSGLAASDSSLTESNPSQAPVSEPPSTSKPSGATSPSSPQTNSQVSIVSKPDNSTVLYGEHFFDDAVFVGDSVSLKLKYYAMKQRKDGFHTLGDAQFLVSGSLGSGNSLMPVTSDSVHPTYQGQKMTLDESICKSGANKVFLMLGMNDIGLYGVDKAMENLDTLINQIRAKSPHASIYLQSVTPMLKGMEKTKLNNTTIQAYNKRLSAYCEAKGYTDVDVASSMMDPDGYLIAEFCSDPESMGIHFTDLACSVWVDTLNSLV
jgi:hypothetical protein